MNVAEGAMLECALCGRRLLPTAAWKGRGEQYYCNGFCAEAEQMDWPPLAAGDVIPGTERSEGARNQ
jgi:hypothetical protein